MSRLIITAAAATDVGRVREHNEDAFLVAERVFAVADGMGGHAAGEVASSLAIESLTALAEREVITLDDVTAAVEAANDGPVSIAVHHLAAADRADRLAVELRQQVPGLVELFVSELGAAIGAHVGPGALGVVIAPSPPQLTEPED